MQLEILACHVEMSRVVGETESGDERMLSELQRKHVADHIVMYRMFGEPPLYLRDRFGFLAIQMKQAARNR